MGSRGRKVLRRGYRGYKRYLPPLKYANLQQEYFRTILWALIEPSNELLCVGRPTMEPFFRQKSTAISRFLPFEFLVFWGTFGSKWPDFDQFWAICIVFRPFFPGRAWPIFTYFDLFRWADLTYFHLFRPISSHNKSMGGTPNVGFSKSPAGQDWAPTRRGLLPKEEVVLRAGTTPILEKKLRECRGK